MLDGAQTTKRGIGLAGLAVTCVLACQPGRAAAQAKQELAGPGRPKAVLLTPRDAVSGSSTSPDMEPVVPFAPGSAQLTPRATRILDRLGRALAEPVIAGDRFRLEGHADGFGSPEMARDLARRRAQAVADYLEQNCAIAAGRLDVAASALRPAREVRVIALQQ